MEAKIDPAELATPAVFVIQLEGEFDLAERDRLIDAFAVAESAQVVAVNLEKTTFIDSSVLQCLVMLQVATRKRGARLILAGVRGTVLRMFEITEMHKVFDIRGTLGDLAASNGAEVRRLTIEARPVRD